MNRARHARRTALRAAGLTPDQVRDLALCHLENLDQIAKGQAGPGTLWQWVAGILTWSRAAQLSGAGAPEMAAQLEVAHGVIERFRRTGRVGFSGTEYQAAKDGVGYMDQIAEIVPRRHAIAAAEWSERRINEMAAGQEA